MGPEITTIVLTLLAVVLGVVAYLKDPGLPLIGARNGLGREGGLRAIVIASVAGILTPGGPMVTVPFLVALANSGAAIAPLVAYMTSWSLFGMQRIIAWEAPLMGWRFVFVRVVPSLAFPVLAGWLVQVFYQD
jgi:uncharacterized membrane protein YraQ (UPF0718 family)